MAILQETALRAVDPADALRRSISEADLLCDGRLILIAAGKAAARMAETLTDLSGDRVAAGVVSAPSTPALHGNAIQYFRGGHPLPTLDSIRAGKAIARMLESRDADDLVVVLLSGGASAMLELPEPGISLRDLQKTNRILLRSGASIREINCIRSPLSVLKSGGLARLAYPARVLGLILSDVVGNAVETIGSGPTVAWDYPRAEIDCLLDRYRLRGLLPQPVLDRLAEYGGHPAPKADPPPRVENRIIASNRMAGEAAAEAARRMGFRVARPSDDWEGEAREVGVRFAELLLSHRGEVPVCCIAGGETTVTLSGHGKGGRNQEAALAAALRIAGESNLAIAAFATDGVDGPTDAAGAIVTGATAGRARRLGLDPAAHLAVNTSYLFFSALGDLVMTGPTGTNVNDLFFGLIYPQ